MKSTKSMAIAAVASLLVWSTGAQNLVVNGDFEDPVLSTWMPYAPGATDLTGWTIDETPPDGVQHFTTNQFASPGSQSVQLTGGANYDKGGSISQMIATTPDAYYVLSIDIASRGSTATATGNFNFGGVNHALSVFGTAISNVTWLGVATASSTLVKITGDPDSGNHQLIIDNVNVVQAVAGPVDPAISTVEALPSSVAADGLSTSTITVRLADASGIPASGKTVTLAQTSGPGTAIITTVSDTTSGGGTATFKVASTTSGLVEFTATDVTDGSLVIAQTANVNFLEGSVANVDTSTVVAEPPSVLADGVATATITVTLKDATNGQVSGKIVTLANTSGPGTPIVTTVSGTSDENGQATFTVASTTAGTVAFTATDVTDGNIAIIQKASVEFTVGPVDPETSTVEAFPTVVPSDNFSVSTITVTLRDATSNGVPDKTVNLVQTSGMATADIYPISNVTDSSGIATFEVSSFSAGDAEFTATDVTDGNLVITQTATMTFSALVSWSGLATTVLDDSDVATDGILRYAEHWAGIDSTVNGVWFAAAQNSVVGSSSGYETLTETNGYPQGSLSTEYWNILRGKWYGAGSGQTVTLKNLQPGHKYLIQIWSSDPRYGPSQFEVILPGFNLGIMEGQYGIGTFTAIGTTQVLGLGGDGVLNAIQVRDLSIIAMDRGPGVGQLTIRGYTELPASVVTETTATLMPPVVWTPIQTNSVPGGNYSFTVPRGAESSAFFRAMVE